jgi:23S rRNA (pseudouridine1915-N3)-methyltransferase
MRLRLMMLGKTHRPEIRAIIDDYIKRIARYAPIDVVEVRETAASLKKLVIDRTATLILLDDSGKKLDSDTFAKWLGDHRDQGTRELVFVCGGAEGFPAEILERAHQKMSLSAMTFSHELARAMLAEQLYRAFAILSGSAYPK